MRDNDDLMANYRKAYDNRVGFGHRPALILIDFCQAYFEPGNLLYAPVEAALESALRLRALARAAGVPVVLTNVVYQAGGLDGGRFFERQCPCAISSRAAPLPRSVPG
jgi:maleamate amidohydrolase